jgi:hypothetical protein
MTFLGPLIFAVITAVNLVVLVLVLIPLCRRTRVHH